MLFFTPSRQRYVYVTKINREDTSSHLFQFTMSGASSDLYSSSR